MFSFFKSEHAKLRESAKNWLYMAGKVYHFRKDRMSESDVDKLVQLSEEVKAQAKSRKSDSERLKSALAGLKEHMEQVGGNYYPRSSLAENVEFFFFAVIVYVGVTTFFVKPFKIPTNSMWPTYYGMTGEVYQDPEDSPNVVERAFRFVAFGATHYDVVAPADGELLVPITNYSSAGYHITPDKVRRFFVLPAPGARYHLRVGEEEVSFKVPSDFDVAREVFDPLFASDGERYSEELAIRYRRNLIADEETVQFKVGHDRIRRGKVYWIRTGRMFKKGETIASFDLMTGDQLFVDRMSYHFVQPKVGDGFVFRTEEIENLEDDKFYIKRLAGTPGDEIQIKGSGLFVNGEPAMGSEAFEMNADEEGLYQGYTYDPPNGEVLLHLENPVTVPDESFLALGDNSYNSSDGRAWGFVPSEAVVGRPIMIYYPFTRRFGLAK